MKQNVEFIRISRKGWDLGTYRGELSVVGASRRRHGRGVMDYDYGERYDGEWSEDQRSGRGVLTWSGGERYRGEFAPGGFHGRGAFHFRNGRLFEGTWAGGAPVVGVALGGDGVAWRAAGDGVWAWGAGGDVPAEWVRTGMEVTGGRPSAEGPWSGECEGAWEREGSERGEGRQRGLRPVAGLVADAGGTRLDVANDAQRTLAEVLMVIPHAVTCRCCRRRRRRDMMISPTRAVGRKLLRALQQNSSVPQSFFGSSIADAVNLWQLNE